LCLLCARAWADVRSRLAVPATAGVRLGVQTIGPILVLARTGGGYFMIARLDLPNAAIIAPVAMLAAGLVVTARVSFAHARLPEVPWVTLTAMVATYAAVIVWVLPALAQRKVVPDVARWVKGHAGDGVRVGTYRLNRWSNAFRFYVDQQTIHMDSIDEARTFFADPSPGYAVMTRQFLYELAGQGIPLQVEYERDGMWVTSGRALWRRREPPTRFVVVSRKTEP